MQNSTPATPVKTSAIANNAQPSASINKNHVYILFGQSQVETIHKKPFENCYSIWRVTEVIEDGLWLSPLWANCLTNCYIKKCNWDKLYFEDKGCYTSGDALKLKKFLKVFLLFKNYSFESVFEYVFQPAANLDLPESYQDYFEGKIDNYTKYDKELRSIMENIK